MPSEIRRLHQASWVFIAGASIKGAIIPALLVVVASSGWILVAYQVLAAVFIVPTVVVAVLRQVVYSYRFADDELIVREGILFKKERHIPYDRVHNVALVQNPFHRMLKVASVRIETATGGAPEAIMRVLSLDDVSELQAHTLHRPDPAMVELAGEDHSAAVADEGDLEAPAPAADATLLKVPTSEFVRLGLISNRGFVVVAAVIGLLSQADWWEYDWEPYVGQVSEQQLDEWALWIFGASILRYALIGLALVVTFIVLLRVFSVCWYVVRYHGFTLSRAGEELRTEYGLFTRVFSIIPAHRIQLLTMRASLLHRWFGRATVEIEMAGASESGSDLQEQLAASGVRTDRQWLAPIVEPDRARALVHEVLPEIDLEDLEWQKLAAGARRRLIKRALLVMLLLTLPLGLGLHFGLSGSFSGLHALWLPAVGLPLAAFYAGKWAEHAGYSLSERAVFFRSGWLSRKVSFVRFNKMQTVALSESPFDRRNRMASVSVDTAGASQMGHKIDIPFLEREVAETIAQRLYAEASRTEYSW